MSLVRLLTALVLLSVIAYPFDDKKKEEITQTLELPKDPPASVTAETSKLIFQVSPLSNKGLLTQQVKDALKTIADVMNAVEGHYHDSQTGYDLIGRHDGAKRCSTYLMMGSE